MSEDNKNKINELIDYYRNNLNFKEDELNEFKKMSRKEFMESKWFKMIEADFIDKAIKEGLK